ncbi:hypothetical protein AUJ77_01200 [Candidatus Nomurabacteria bacterium CG1_02_43_90]|uniref:DUF5667 domain-containing protein n=1 Tax=Candidatus Nomurabacteria bacterium CG1_02_43_90 TaxID=1805281 RepID=A0A1J4V4M2_9BACT|nr:MAG: hypothetical protein AUJ77_01200 [Candidatus Nomurabacteria bacterium CG1_02_43_90]
MKKNISAIALALLAGGAMIASAQSIETTVSGEATMNARPGIMMPPVPPIGVRPELRDLRQEANTVRKDFVASTTQMRNNIRVEMNAKAQKMQARERMLRASTTEIQKDVRGKIRVFQASTTEARKEIQDRERMLQASTTEMRKEIQNRTNSIKDVAQKKRIELANQQAHLVGIRLNTATDRIQKISDRVSLALDTLEAKGSDVSVSRSHLASAKTNLDEARAKTITVKFEITSALASQAPKEGLLATEPLIKEAVQNIQDAQNEIAQAISIIK